MFNGKAKSCLVDSRASLTVRITVKNGDPSGAGKIWENRFFTGKMDHHGAKCTQIGAQTCQGPSRTCQNFFTFTFKAARVTFLKVIFQFTEKVLNRPFWISLAVISYLLPPVFLTPLPPLSVIAWKILVPKNVILIKIWSELLYFLSQFYIFSF